MGRRVVLIMVVLATLGVLALASTQALAGPMPGAIFTTTADGSRVNANIFAAKEDVYLDGGPGSNAPAGAAGLNEGDYYFQVTDPSGKVLLSTDAVKCRRVHVNSSGVIDHVYPCTKLTKVRGVWVEVDCTHKTGIDIDHPELGAITVQLMPYLDTPNKGGVYKVWITPCENFIGDPNLVDNGYSPGNYHGFRPPDSKTDNFKVRRNGPPYTPPVVTVKKFNDANGNGIWDAGELEITGWRVDAIDPLGVTNTYYTPIQITTEPAGFWNFVEEQREGWMYTCTYLDGVRIRDYPAAYFLVAGTSRETHEVIFGNIQLARLTVCKFYDLDGDGIWDAGEPGIPGWWIYEHGTTVAGWVWDSVSITKSNGCDTFWIMPGLYDITERMPLSGGWVNTTPTTRQIQLASGDSARVEFGNIRQGQADFDTKGYWHNKNGLGETTPSDIAYLNSLAPWQAPSSYFGAGDEPIDGFFANGTPVAAANGDWGETIAPAGSALAEQSHFLVDSNAGGDPREQLAQQLDAFIMNCRHRLGSVGAAIWLNGSWGSTQTLVTQAIQIWQSGSDSQRTAMAGLLDSLNNNDAVPFILPDIGTVVYP